MVKKLVLLSVLFYGIAIIHSSCERDDICAEDTLTTPNLIIRFVDMNTGTEPKSPNELLLLPIGFEDSIVFSTNVDSIVIPLRTDADITNYEFIIDADTTDDATIPNRDTLSFQYTVEQEYLSSACGFRATFNGLTFTPPSSDSFEDDNTWIREITIENTDIINEQDTHVFILF
ncbi:DUF6452 family protein [Aquimarina sp. ERC-38]|uniref:DUF6452 family protein n=1 Tax=Aquimarina sp. ERC-38 TaxID=2949996 RepID=UPI0022453F5A|nr:DUF6452 family protein [Aquimarina sp. ERC-38]UZO79512.1 DUF6452 family protein [Aquimarina sp. ERC-38]